MNPKKSTEAFIAAQIELTGYLVLRDGAVCKLVNVSGSHVGGVLMPGTPGITFLKPRDARRAIQRTENVRANIRTSLVSEWMATQMPAFLQGEKFEIFPLGKQV